jgi:hypothetical protein
MSACRRVLQDPATGRAASGTAAGSRNHPAREEDQWTDRHGREDTGGDERNCDALGGHGQNGASPDSHYSPPAAPHVTGFGEPKTGLNARHQLPLSVPAHLRPSVLSRGCPGRG